MTLNQKSVIQNICLILTLIFIMLSFYYASINERKLEKLEIWEVSVFLTIVYVACISFTFIEVSYINEKSDKIYLKKSSLFFMSICNMGLINLIVNWSALFENGSLIAGAMFLGGLWLTVWAEGG